ncbi:MAG: MMPL family transporter [Chloroflexi bacterium]|nr:MMPL family transporter [Chloroflexota bacterium]
MFLRYGRWACRRRWPLVAAWVVLLLVAIPAVPAVFRVLSAGGFSADDLEAVRAGQLLADRFGSSTLDVYAVYTDPSGALPASGEQFKADVDASLAQVRSLPEVDHVTTPATQPGQVAPDDQAAYATIAVKSDAADSRDVLPHIEQALQPTGLTVTFTGASVFYQDIYDVTERDLRRAEVISFPFAAAALLLVFGSVVAGAVPGVVGGASVLVTFGILVLASRFTNLSIFSLNLTTMLGLGLGIDYSLFIVSRFREELSSPRGRSVDEAVARSIATAGRAVLFSGITVCIGMLALLTFDISALRSLGLAGSLVVAVSVVAALTLLPAALSLLGRRIDALPLRRLRPPSATASDHGFWASLAHTVMAHPVAVLLPMLVLLLALGLPFLQVELGAPDASILPTDVQSRQGFDLLRTHWGEGELSPVLIVFQAQSGSPLQPDRVGALYDYVRRVEADPRVARVDSIVSLDPRLTREQYQFLYTDPDHIGDPIAALVAQATVRDDLVVVTATSRYGQTDVRSKDLVRSIRATPPPTGFTMLVGGGTAGVVDYADRLYDQFPRAALLVVAAIYLVLLVSFRSVVIPVKAILMNVLSIVASYGALVVVFQDGALSGPLRFTPLGFVEASLPILMFCVLFGLSMDYEVFLLSRIKEAYDSGLDNTTSVALGLQRSGRIITSAAGIVVLVSLSFVAADIVLIKALGLGTAIAVFLDATVVRALLVPATMRLLGDWNWWAPGWVRRRLPASVSHAG